MTDISTKWQAMKARQEHGSGGMKLAAVLVRTGHDYAIIGNGSTSHVDRDAARQFYNLARLMGAVVRGDSNGMFLPHVPRWTKAYVFVWPETERVDDIEVLPVAEQVPA